MTFRNKQSGDPVVATLSSADRIAALGLALGIVIAIVTATVWISERLTRVETKVDYLERKLP